jgi:hypothetical protein
VHRFSVDKCSWIKTFSFNFLVNVVMKSEFPPLVQEANLFYEVSKIAQLVTIRKSTISIRNSEIKYHGRWAEPV